jgi:hypothetical protein
MPPLSRIRRSGCRAVAACLVVTASAWPARASETEPGPAATMAFARYLEQDEPRMAVGEYRRLLHASTAPAALETRARIRLAALLARMDRTVEASVQLGRAASRSSEADRPLVLWAQARASDARGRHDEAAGYYEALSAFPDHRLAAGCAMIWSRVAARDWAAALAAIDRLAEAHPASAPRLGMLRERLAIHAAREVLHPEQARWWSAVLPGSGQLLAGDVGSALGSFAVNAGWIGAFGYEVAVRRDWAGALFLANYGPRYYLGGIHRAGEAAETRIAAADDELVRRLSTDFRDLVVEPPLPAGELPGFTPADEPV